MLDKVQVCNCFLFLFPCVPFPYKTNMQIRVLERQDAARRKKEEVERRAAERAEIMEEMKRHQKQVLPRVLAPASSTCTLAFSFVPSHPRVQSGVGTRGPWKLALIGC